MAISGSRISSSSTAGDATQAAGGEGRGPDANAGIHNEDVGEVHSATSPRSLSRMTRI